MFCYISYTNEDRLAALKVNQELNKLGVKTCFIDRDENISSVDPLEDIMNSIKSSSAFVILHSEHTNYSVLSQLEITYSRNIGSKMYLLKMGKEKISDAIKFEIGNCKIITDKNLSSAINNLAKQIKKDLNAYE